MSEAVNKQAFYSAIVAICAEIAVRTGGKMLVGTQLVQAAEETGYYAGGCWRGIQGWRGLNNLSGISPGGQIADYGTEQEYETAYVDVISQNGFGYPHVLEVASLGVHEQLIALGFSKWNATSYAAGGQVAGRLLAIWSTDAAIIQQVLQDANIQEDGTMTARVSGPPTKMQTVNLAPIVAGAAVGVEGVINTLATLAKEFTALQGDLEKVKATLAEVEGLAVNGA